ncbi:MAG: PhoH family protein [Pirellulales bacterium]
MIEATIPVGNPDQLVLLFGASDQHLRQIRESIPARISTRNGRIHLSGDEQAVLQATSVFEQLKSALNQDGPITPVQVSEIVRDVIGRQNGKPAPKVEVGQLGVSVRPRTQGQGVYIEAIRTHDLVFCIGPAGTGKTYLAVATAVEALRQQQIRKIVLVRPAVEAGESLGYLPGDLQAKINPYLRPLLDALGEMMDYDQVKRYMAEDIIEVVPLAYMRGRTLNNAFIVMDEAQNTTVAQMKMFLTRMGANSKIVVSGDTSQIDLPSHAKSGLIDAISRLRNIPGVAHVTLSTADIVRHRLVQEIVKAYDEDSRKKR